MKIKQPLLILFIMIFLSSFISASSSEFLDNSIQFVARSNFSESTYGVYGGTDVTLNGNLGVNSYGNYSFGSGLSYDGTADYVDMKVSPNDLKLYEGFTLHFIANMTDDTGAYLLGSSEGSVNDGAIFIYRSGTNSATFSVRDDNGNGGECNENTGTNASLFDGTEHHYIFEYDGTDTRLYINNVLKDSGATDCGVNMSVTYDMWIGDMNWGGAGLGKWKTGIHEIEFYNITTTTNEQRLTMINSTYPRFVTGGTPPLSGVVDLLFIDEDNHSHQNFSVAEEFVVNINYTLSNGTIIENGVCNVTGENVIVPTKLAPSNFTLCNIGCNFSTFTDSVNTDGMNLLDNQVTNNSLHLKICHENIAQGVVSINLSCDSGSQLWELQPEEYAICSAGETEFFFETPTCKDDDVNNVTITGNLIPQRSKRITKINIDKEYRYLKYYANYSTTTQLYSTNKDIEYYISGTKNFTSECDNPLTVASSKEENIVITGVEPTIIHSIVLVDVIEYPLIDGQVIEYDISNFTFEASIFDFNLAEANHTLLCSNGSVLDVDIHNISGSDDAHIISGDTFRDFECNPYVYVTKARDTTNLTSTLNTTFNVSDTINPQVSGFSDSSHLINSTVEKSITFTDESFYSFNITCNNSFNEYTNGLNVASYNYLLNFTMPSYDVLCEVYYCDGHTARELKYDWDVITTSDTFKFRINNYIEKRLRFEIDDNITLSYKEYEDKISFTVETENKINHNWIVYYDCEDCHYFKDDKYKAWIVDPKTNTWLDLNGVKEEISVFYNNGTFELRFNSDDKKIIFESIGELNCQNSSMTLTALTYMPSTFDVWYGDITNPNNCKMNDVKDILILFFVYGLLLLFFFINNLVLDYPIIDFTVGVVMLAYSISLYSCGMLITLTLSIFSLMILVYGMFER